MNFDDVKNVSKVDKTREEGESSSVKKKRKKTSSEEKSENIASKKIKGEEALKKEKKEQVIQVPKHLLPSSHFPSQGLDTNRLLKISDRTREERESPPSLQKKRKKTPADENTENIVSKKIKGEGALKKKEQEQVIQLASSHELDPKLEQTTLPEMAKSNMPSLKSTIINQIVNDPQKYLSKEQGKALPSDIANKILEELIKARKCSEDNIGLLSNVTELTVTRSLNAKQINLLFSQFGNTLQRVSIPIEFGNTRKDVSFDALHAVQHLSLNTSLTKDQYDQIGKTVPKDARISINLASASNIARVLECVKCLGSKTHSLQLPDKDLTDGEFKAICNHCPNLETLIIPQGRKITSVAGISLPKLTHLNIKYFKLTAQASSELTKMCGNLEILDLRYGSIDFGKAQFPKLRVCNAVESNFNAENVQHLSKTSGNSLEKLHISKDRAFDGFANCTFTNLTSLSLLNTKATISEDMIHQLHDMCGQTLRHLEAAITALPDSTNGPVFPVLSHIQIRGPVNTNMLAQLSHLAPNTDTLSFDWPEEWHNTPKKEWYEDETDRFKECNFPRLDNIRISSIDNTGILNVSKKFGNQLQVLDLNGSSSLKSMKECTFKTLKHLRIDGCGLSRFECQCPQLISLIASDTKFDNEGFLEINKQCGNTLEELDLRRSSISSLDNFDLKKLRIFLISSERLASATIQSTTASLTKIGKRSLAKVLIGVFQRQLQEKLDEELRKSLPNTEIIESPWFLMPAQEATDKIFNN